MACTKDWTWQGGWLTPLAIGLLLLAAVLSSCSSSNPRGPDHVIVIGLDGATFDVMLPLLRGGELPTFKRLIDQGLAERLSTLRPTSSPVLWTTVATGKHPGKHGIYGFVDSEGTPLTSNMRRTKAVWSILSERDISVDVVGWWATWPAENVKGVMVSSYAALTLPIRKGLLWQDLPRQTYPEEVFAEIKPVIEETERDLDGTLADIFPSLAEESGDAVVDKNIVDVRWGFKGDQLFFRTARLLQEKRPARVLLVYLGGLDVVGHRFWKYYEPEAYHYSVPQEEIDRYGTVMTDYYRYTDGLIQELLDGTEGKVTVFIVSDHGMHAVNLEDPAAQLSGHHMDAPPGIFIASGFGIEPVGMRSLVGKDASKQEGERVIGSIADVAPSLLYLLDLPVAKDMDGSALTDIFTREFREKHPLRYVETYEEDVTAREEAEKAVRSPVDEELRRRLRALGYIK